MLALRSVVPGPMTAPVETADLPEDVAVRQNRHVSLDAGRSVDVGRRRVADRDAGEHVPFQDAPAHDALPLRRASGGHRRRGLPSARRAPSRPGCPSRAASGDQVGQVVLALRAHRHERQTCARARRRRRRIGPALISAGPSGAVVVGRLDDSAGCPSASRTTRPRRPGSSTKQETKASGRMMRASRRLGQELSE